MLCLAGMTGFAQSKSRLLGRVASELPKGSGFDPAMLDLRYRYESASSYPRIRHVYGAQAISIVWRPSGSAGWMVP